MYFKYKKDLCTLKIPQILLGLYSPDYSLLTVASKNYVSRLFLCFPLKEQGFFFPFVVSGIFTGLSQLLKYSIQDSKDNFWT